MQVQPKPQVKAGGTTFDVVDKLEQARAAVVSKLTAIKDDPNLVMRCEAILSGYSDLADNIRSLAPQVEQLKGLSKGIVLAAPMVRQHTEILKQKYPGLEDSDKLKFGIEVVHACWNSVNDAAKSQREELVKTTGKFDGSVNSALSLIRKVEEYITNYERAKESEAEFDNDPLDEVRLRPGSNGVKAVAKKPPKKAGRKKATRKKTKAAGKAFN